MPAVADNIIYRRPTSVSFILGGAYVPTVCGQSHTIKPYFPVKYFARARLCSSKVLLKIVFPSGVER